MPVLSHFLRVKSASVIPEADFIFIQNPILQLQIYIFLSYKILFIVN